MSSQSLTFALLGQVARYTETLARDPQSTAFVPLAETFRQHGLLVEACAVAEKGVQTLPDHAPGYIVLGRIQAQLGHLKQAVGSFDAALALDEENADGLKGLARLCLLQGESSRARNLLTRVLTSNPGDEVAKKMFSTLPAEPVPVERVETQGFPAGKPSAIAGEEIKPSRGGRSSINPSGPISTATIAEIYVRQGFTLRALKVYRDLLQADPHNEEIRRKLVDLKERIEREESGEAGHAVEKAVETIDPTPLREKVLSAGAQNPVAGANIGVLGQLEKWLTAIEQRRGNV